MERQKRSANCPRASRAWENISRSLRFFVNRSAKCSRTRSLARSRRDFTAGTFRSSSVATSAVLCWQMSRSTKTIRYGAGRARTAFSKICRSSPAIKDCSGFGPQSPTFLGSHSSSVSVGSSNDTEGRCLRRHRSDSLMAIRVSHVRNVDSRRK